MNTPPGTGDYYDPGGYTYHANGAFGSRHTGGANFGFGDAHVKFIEDTIDFEVYRQMSSRDDSYTILMEEKSGI